MARATAVVTVTDGQQPTQGPERSVIQARVAPSGGSSGRARTARQRRRAHPLLQAFPLAVMALATFLVLFSLMAARLKASATTALPSSSAAALVAGRSRGSSVTTRASGGAARIATPVALPAGAPATRPAIVTRPSGIARAGETVDD
jgi:hypothetical protein